jgi:hypothetical protein
MATDSDATAGITRAISADRSARTIASRGGAVIGMTKT